MLGDELFKKCLHTYMDRWHGRHPIPWDFFYSFNDASGKDLNWFWYNWFFTNNYLDIAVGTWATIHPHGNNAGSRVSMIVVRISAVWPSLSTAELHYTDGSTSTTHFTPVVWNKDQTQQRSGGSAR